MKKKEQKVVFYRDELNDDFAGNGIDTKKVPNDFKYINKNILFRINSFLLRYLFAVPLLWIANTFIFKPKIVNKKLLKSVKRKGYYVYSNHVLPYDPVILPVKTNPGKLMIIIAGPDLFSIHPFVTWLVKHFGAIPVPNQDATMCENFVNCLSYNVKRGKRVLIFPEAHIWPYYNGIRNFKAASFRYPVNDNAPVIVSTTTFKQRKGNRKPKPVIYLDGPFYPDQSLSAHEQIKELRNRVYETMKWRASQEGNFEYIKYVKKED